MVPVSRRAFLSLLASVPWLRGRWGIPTRVIMSEEFPAISPDVLTKFQHALVTFVLSEHKSPWQP